ncbi:ExeM/NucH family extracellular endonuclease [Lysobacter pythonis]|uniref:ExeM/NucH family extracellular endonuclease n=1 Tax=Solilutibacter pythonis TaxID=2483112 RepID=A0A3M2I073_9GAMM|nr:ExeM/NucH family extracellular endonuclease [Lysobacter pythonis]RMH93795.1 ExeM/NucH family extracellular endonuclease [Lysobacter pythonis]
MRPIRPFVPPLLAALLAGCLSSPPPAAPAALAIGAVQGAGPRSPLTGREVRVAGVITADFSPGLGLLALQDDGDGDDATSDALFLAGAPAGLKPGDALSVRGVVVELDSGRETTVTALRVIEARALPPRPLPAARPLAAAPASPAGWESLEAMRVGVPVALTLTGTRNAARFGEWQASTDGRLWTPTEIARPGPAAAALGRRNHARTLWLDDGHARARAGTAMSREIPRTGSVLSGVEGIVDQRFGRYRLQLAAMPRVAAAARPAPPARAGDLRIVAFNLQNLFNGDGKGGGFPTARGAATQADYLRQRARHVAVLAALDADIVALMELENDGQDALSSESQLLAALNLAHGGDWKAVPVPANASTDAIRVGIVYRASKVRLLGAADTLDDDTFATRNRPPLAARFRAGAGPAFAVIANHLKSKGCRDAKGADADQRDGQSCWSATRLDAVQKLDRWYRQRFATMPALMLGDFNAYAMEDPPRWLRDAGWRDAFADTDTDKPYSYVYDGQAGRLDHAFLNAAMAARLAAATEWHINADEPDLAPAADAPAAPWRSADHDPLAIDLRLGARRKTHPRGD